MFNYVNLHVYHYAGNNPVKYIDPDGRDDDLPQVGASTVLAEVNGGIAYPLGLSGSEFENHVTSTWGPDRESIIVQGNSSGNGHNGIDLRAPIGTRVNAVGGGRVVFVGNAPNGYGNYLIILHPSGNRSLYAHLNCIYVRQGQVVVAGQHIADVGNTGISTGPHLHFSFDGNGDGDFSNDNPADNPARILFSGGHR